MEDNKIRIRNKRTGEVRYVTPEQAVSLGMDPADVLARIESLQDLKTYTETGEIPTEESKKTGSEEDQIFKQTQGIINRLFSEYETLSEEDKGAMKSIAANVSPDIAARNGWISPQAAEYEKARKGLAGVLKDLVGETGVLTDGDINRIAGLFPSLAAVEGQAEISKDRFNDFSVAKFGEGKEFFPEAKKEDKTTTPSVEDTDIAQDVVSAPKAITAGPMSTTPELQSRMVQSGKQPVDIQAAIDQAQEDASFIPQSILEPLASIQEFGANSQALPIAGATLGSFIGGPFGTAGGTIIGRQLKRGLGDRAEGDSTLDALTMNPFDAEERGQAFEDLKAAAIAAIIDKFFRGGGFRGNLGQIRGNIASRSSATVAGDDIAQAAMNAAENAPATLRRTAQKKAMDAIEKFGGKNLSLLEAIAERTAAGNAARSLSSGNVKSTAAAQVEEAIRSALRSGIREGSSGVALIDDALSTLFSLQNTGGKIAGKVALPAGLAVGGGLIARAIQKAL